MYKTEQEVEAAVLGGNDPTASSEDATTDGGSSDALSELNTSQSSLNAVSQYTVKSHKPGSCLS